MPHPRAHAGGSPADAIATVPPGVGGRHVQRAAGSGARGLNELAEEERAELLVLGSHVGPDGRITPGSTTMRLLQGAPCAIAIAPRGLRERERLHHVGVAYDGSDEARHALALAYALAARDGAAVTIYRAIPRVGSHYAGSVARELDAAVQRQRLDAQGQLDEAADAAPPGVNPRTVLVHAEPEGVAREAEGIVDLLITGSRGYGPMQRVFMGSASEAILLDATQPVLLVPRTSLPDGAPPLAQTAARD
jgi:nucleotide-binding universal stress UspA family protein